MGYGPFQHMSKMRQFLENSANSADTIFYTVVRNQDKQAIGMCSYLRDSPVHCSIEIGHIWYGAAAQRTGANTESAYLLLQNAFEVLGYRRLEWKCDALNAASRAAARRLGFEYEGIFKDHMVYKGRNRDTAWFAMLAADWPSRKIALEAWLENPGTRSLADIRSVNTAPDGAGV